MCVWDEHLHLTVWCCVLSSVVYTAMYEREMVQVDNFRFRVLKSLLQDSVLP